MADSSNIRDVRLLNNLAVIVIAGLLFSFASRLNFFPSEIWTIISGGAAIVLAAPVTIVLCLRDPAAISSFLRGRNSTPDPQSPVWKAITFVMIGVVAWVFFYGVIAQDVGYILTRLSPAIVAKDITGTRHATYGRFKTDYSIYTDDFSYGLFGEIHTNHGEYNAHPGVIHLQLIGHESMFGYAVDHYAYIEPGRQSLSDAEIAENDVK